MTDVPNLKAVEKLARKNGWDYVAWSWDDTHLIVIFGDENKVGVVPGQYTDAVVPTSDHLWPFCLRDDINAILDRLGDPQFIRSASVVNVSGGVRNGVYALGSATFKLEVEVYVAPVVSAPVTAMIASLSKDGFAVPPDVLERALEAAMKEQG